MKKILGTAILTGAFAVMAALPVTATAGPAGRGRAMGNSITTQTHAGEQIRVRQHLRDGSRLAPAKPGARTMQKKGHTYGPGDGTGNLGDGPMDGTGYVAPSQK